MSLISLVGSLILGVSLAASCGLRAFLPLFVAGLGARLGFVDIGDAFHWLQSTPCLLALGTGVVCELVADKVPLLSHLLDLLATPVRTAAGMLVVAATLVDLPAWVVALLAIIVGGGVALAVHVAKSGARLGSSAVTAGAAAPAHSLLEDVVCAAASVLSVVFWVVAFVVAAAALALFWVTARAVWQRFRR
jgi:hypothetical protein